MVEVAEEEAVGTAAAAGALWSVWLAVWAGGLAVAGVLVDVVCGAGLDELVAVLLPSAAVVVAEVTGTRSAVHVAASSQAAERVRAMREPAVLARAGR